MKFEEVVELVEQIGLLYRGRFQLSDPAKTVKAWHGVLKDKDGDTVRANFRRHVEISPFVPTISDLLKKEESVFRSVKNVQETQEYIAEMDRRANEPKDEEQIAEIKKQIRETLTGRKGEDDGIE